VVARPAPRLPHILKLDALWTVELLDPSVARHNERLADTDELDATHVGPSGWRSNSERHETRSPTSPGSRGPGRAGRTP